jgi:hypothetical protein
MLVCPPWRIRRKINLIPTLQHGVHKSQSREGWLRRDREVFVVGEVLTAEDYRVITVSGVAEASADSSQYTACDVGLTTHDAGPNETIGERSGR